MAMGSPSSMMAWHGVPIAMRKIPMSFPISLAIDSWTIPWLVDLFARGMVHESIARDIGKLIGFGFPF